MVARGLVHACASEELLYLLAGLSLQADFGDHSALPDNTQPYFKPAAYFPQQVAYTKITMKLYLDYAIQCSLDKWKLV